MIPNQSFPIFRVAGALAVALLLLASPLRAQSENPDERLDDRIRAGVEASMDSLQLTGEQRKVVQPILEESFERRLAVLEKYGIDLEDPDGIDRPGFFTMRKLRKDINRVRKDTENQLKSVLTDEQMDEWKELEKERQKRMRERF